MQYLGPIKHLTFISSESCNLNCSYCEIAKSHSENHMSEARKVKEALESGVYLDNVKKIFEKYSLDPKEVIQIQLWGQEPTLTLEHFTNQFPNIYEYFPNITSSFFSTNGVAFPEKIVDYCRQVNNTVSGEFELRFQFSYDGYKYTKEARGIDPNIILNNIKKVVEGLNALDLNIQVTFGLHNVVTLDIMNELNTDDKIIAYWKEFEDISNEIQSLVKDPQHVIVTKSASCGLINPYNATIKDGKRFFEFYQDCKRIYSGTTEHSYYGLCEQFLVGYRSTVNLLNTYKIKVEELIDYITLIDVLSYNHPILDMSISMLGCGVANGDLKVRYDGQLIHCQNAIFGLDKDDLLDKTGLRYEVQKQLIDKNSFPNLLDDEYKEIEKFLYRFRTAGGSFPWIYSQIVNLMYILSELNQIDNSYKNNPKKILIHALLIVNTFFCFDNNIQETSSLTGRSMGLIRLFANGMLDELVNEIKERFYDCST